MVNSVSVGPRIRDIGTLVMYMAMLIRDEYRVGCRRTRPVEQSLGSEVICGICAPEEPHDVRAKGVSVLELVTAIGGELNLLGDHQVVPKFSH